MHVAADQAGKQISKAQTLIEDILVAVPSLFLRTNILEKVLPTKSKSIGEEGLKENVACSNEITW